ncbi:chemotaxis protein CheB (plasmid) [Methylocystis echinoides]
MLVGIGASAGGLEALKTLLPALPSDSGLAFVIVVHLRPGQPSVMAEVLQPFCSMPVTQVTEDQEIEPNHIYVIPPGCNLSTIDSRLRLSKIEEGRQGRAPIDHFFETLASTHGHRSIGVILSGTGADGSFGLKQIKEQGGLTIAQDPKEAQFDSMPHNAILTGQVDFVLPIRDMPWHMLRFATTQPRVEIAEPLEQAPAADREILQNIMAQGPFADEYGFFKIQACDGAPPDPPAYATQPEGIASGLRARPPPTASASGRSAVRPARRPIASPCCCSNRPDAWPERRTSGSSPATCMNLRCARRERAFPGYDRSQCVRGARLRRFFVKEDNSYRTRQCPGSAPLRQILD